MPEPREHALLMKAPMVRATLKEIEAPGTGKSQTRRLLTKHNATFGSAPRLFWEHANFERAWVDGKGSGSEYLHVPCHRGDSSLFEALDETWTTRGGHRHREHFPDCSPCETCEAWGWPMTSHRLYPKWGLGERIWVRETWQENEPPSGWIYRADDVDGHIDSGWRPSIHMPREACRITGDILSVRIERLQDISEADALAEGVDFVGDGGSPYGIKCLPESWGLTARNAFRHLWNAINPAHPWESNPWLAAISFRPEVANG